MTARARAAAQKALGRRDLAWLVSAIPASDRADPAALRSWLTLAADYDQSEAMTAAHAAVTAWQAESALEHRVAALYWDPKIRSEFGPEAVERAWTDPASARQMLIDMSAKGRLSREADAALGLLSEVQEYAQTIGESLPSPAVAPLPSDASAAADSEAAELVAKSATTRLTEAENTRLHQLYESRVAREERSAAAESARPPSPPSRRQELIDKSATGLSAAENDELSAIYAAIYVEEAGDTGGTEEVP